MGGNGGFALLTQSPSTLPLAPGSWIQYVRLYGFANVLRLHVCVSVQACIRVSVLPSLLDKALPGQRLNPVTLDLHISPLAEAQLVVSMQTPDQAPDSLSNPGHTAHPQAKVLKHTHGPYNLEVTLMCLPAPATHFLPAGLLPVT